ncbi:MAG: hypothetical protein PF484_01095 [Bacteroidales bacterium]|jgi:hypothetical protein|nr:hypothetical protein [Bacteroidales bacterium]
MQTKEAFQQLSIVQQMLLIMDTGYTLLARKEYPLSIKLFELNGFYVEVKYHYLDNKIVSVEVVNLDDVTDDYLANIHIENIY